MLLSRSRFLPIALGVLAIAFTQPLAQPAGGHERLRDAVRSGEDAGFSITLTSPRSPYLLGRQAITIEPTVPRNDALAQVDIFVDGRLLCTDRQEPYTCDSEFGEEIRRHTIVASAITRGGRRARVSFVSRSADPSENAPGAVEVLPVIVRDAAGQPVANLTVSDFALFEDGMRQAIVHFDDQSGPLSIAVLIDPQEGGEEARAALVRGAAAFLGPLPPYQALGLLDAWRTPSASIDFTYRREPFLEGLAAGDLAPPPRPVPLAVSMTAAAEGLKKRPGGRVIVLLTAARPPLIGPPLPPGEPAPAGREAAESPPAPTIETAVDAMKQARATLFVLTSGAAGEGPPWDHLRRAAEESGGETLVAPAPAGVEDLARSIADTLQHQYRLAFVPESPGRSGWRKLDLRLARPDLQMLARKGYAPAVATR